MGLHLLCFNSQTNFMGVVVVAMGRTRTSEPFGQAYETCKIPTSNNPQYLVVPGEYDSPMPQPKCGVLPITPRDIILVDPKGFEPLTSTVQMSRSTNWSYGPLEPSIRIELITSRLQITRSTN